MVDPLNGSNSMRMFGLASGLDIDSMVEKLMTAERVPLDQMVQQKQMLQWQQDDYRSMNSLLLDLYNSTFDMTLQSSYLSKQAVSTDESLITATALSTASKTAYSITGGTTAKAANMKSASSIGTNIDTSKSLWENRTNIPNFTYATTSTGAVQNKTIDSPVQSLFIGNKYVDKTTMPSTITVTNSDGTTSDYTVIYDISKLDPNIASGQVYLDVNSGTMVFNKPLQAGSSVEIPVYSYGTGFDMTAEIKAADSTGKMVDKVFSFTPDQSINSILDTINNSELNVSAFYGTNDNKISITSNQTGKFNTAGNDIIISGTLFTSTFGLTNYSDGQDATLEVNGVQVKSHTNSFKVNGVTFDLKANIPAGTTVTVGITDDSSAVYDKIKSWVDKYNDTIQKMNDKLSEKRYRDYPPLTDAQKKDMKDSDIELWNGKAHSGMLADDTLLSGGLAQMRVDIYSTVKSVSDSDFNQLSEIGIKTSSEYTDNGKLIIDEKKLKAAIADNPQAVMELFTNNGKSGLSDTVVYDNEGIMQRLQNTIKNTMNDVYQKAGKDSYTYDQYAIGKSMHDFDKRISDFQQRLNDIQTRYYKQFTAMEQAIQAANQQGAFLMSNFGGGA